jgi:hypothetical protein
MTDGDPTSYHHSLLVLASIRTGRQRGSAAEHLGPVLGRGAWPWNCAPATQTLPEPGSCEAPRECGLRRLSRGSPHTGAQHCLPQISRAKEYIYATAMHPMQHGRDADPAKPLLGETARPGSNDDESAPRPVLQRRHLRSDSGHRNHPEIAQKHFRFLTRFPEHDHVVVSAGTQLWRIGVRDVAPPIRSHAAIAFSL